MGIEEFCGEFVQKGMWNSKPWQTYLTMSGQMLAYPTHIRVNKTAFKGCTKPLYIYVFLVSSCFYNIVFWIGAFGDSHAYKTY